MKIRPLSDRIVIRPAQAEEKTKGGIIVPDTAKDKPVRGEITAAGPGKTSEDGKRIPLDLKVGDKVLYGKYSGTEVTIDEEDLLIMRESDVFAILTDGKAK